MNANERPLLVVFSGGPCSGWWHFLKFLKIAWEAANMKGPIYILQGGYQKIAQIQPEQASMLRTLIHRLIIKDNPPVLNADGCISFANGGVDDAEGFAGWQRVAGLIKAHFEGQDPIVLTWGGGGSLYRHQKHACRAFEEAGIQALYVAKSVDADIYGVGVPLGALTGAEVLGTELRKLGRDSQLSQRRLHIPLTQGANSGWLCMKASKNRMKDFLIPEFFNGFRHPLTLNLLARLAIGSTVKVHAGVTANKFVGDWVPRVVPIAEALFKNEMVSAESMSQPGINFETYYRHRNSTGAGIPIAMYLALLESACYDEINFFLGGEGKFTIRCPEYATYRARVKARFDDRTREKHSATLLFARVVELVQQRKHGHIVWANPGIASDRPLSEIDFEGPEKDRDHEGASFRPAKIGKKTADWLLSETGHWLTQDDINGGEILDAMCLNSGGQSPDEIHHRLQPVVDYYTHLRSMLEAAA